jgi:hypothetical protein
MCPCGSHRHRGALCVVLARQEHHAQRVRAQEELVAAVLRHELRAL